MSVINELNRVNRDMTSLLRNQLKGRALLLPQRMWLLPVHAEASQIAAWQRENIVQRLKDTSGRQYI